MKQKRFWYFFNDRQHFRRFLWGMTAVVFLAGIGAMFVPQAWAAAFSCSGGSGNGNLFDQDTIGNVVNDSSGGTYTINTSTTYTNGDPFGTVCPANLGIFGTVLCFFKSTIGQITSTMYCGIQQDLLSPLSIAIELFIVIFGVTVMTGMVRFTPREAIMALLKVALVFVFATNAAWGIGIGYNFFIGFAEQGSNMVLNAVGNASGGAASGGGGYLTQPDNVLQGMFSLVSTGAAGTGAPTMPSTLTSTCAIWLIAFVVLLVLFVPMVGGFLVTMMIQYIMLYVRAFLGYLTALVLISFLFVLSPLFISFALFQITRPLFDSWLKYLISYALQMVVVFAFLVLLNLIPLGAFFSEMLGLLRQYDIVSTASVFPIPSTFCSVCDYTIGSGNITDATPPITCADNNAIPIGRLFLATDLIKAVLSQIVALWIVGTVMQDFLKSAPGIASEIASAMPAFSMGGSVGGGGVTFAGLDSGWGESGGAIDSEENMSGLRDRIDSFRSEVSPRAAPLLLAGGWLVTKALNKNANVPTSSGSGASAGGGKGSFAGSGFGGGTANAGGSNPGSMARSAGSGQASGSASSSASQSGGISPNAPSFMRSPLISNQSLMLALTPSLNQVTKKTNYLAQVMGDNETYVQQALQDVTAYRQAINARVELTPIQTANYNQALAYLHQTNETWQLAVTDLTASNAALVKDAIAKSEVNPQGSKPNKLSDVLSVGDLGEQAKFSARNIALQIEVQQTLSRQAIDPKLQKDFDSALDDIANINDADNPSETLNDVLDRLNHIEEQLKAVAKSTT